MFGGWSLPSGTMWEMAEQYFDAANLLVANITRNDVEDYKLSTPVIYLYRHWLELAVKSVVGQVRGHDLAKLSSGMARLLASRGVNVPAWVTARFKEMSRIDPSSTAFRYAENAVAGEIYVSLPHLRGAMVFLHAALASVVTRGKFPPHSLFVRIAEDPTSEWVRLHLFEWFSSPASHSKSRLADKS
jgi:hypothetical protein